VVADSLLDGAGLTLSSDTGSGTRWMVVDDGAGNLQIANGCSGKSLDVDGGESSLADGAKVMQYRWWNTKNQKWSVREVPASSIRPRAPERRRILSATAGSIRVEGDPSLWEHLDILDPAGRRLASLPVRAEQSIPSLPSGIHLLRLSGRGGEETAVVSAP